ncbi:hypothetical protein THAOC_37168, partial [Thalassiosira oceanica]
RPPSVQATVAERVAAGQIQRVFRFLEAYAACRLSDNSGGISAVNLCGHAGGDYWQSSYDNVAL